MKKMLAEFVGTAAFVLLGCGAIVLGGEAAAPLGVALAFGFTAAAMMLAFGAISGGHINPAVSFGAFIAGRLGPAALAQYWIAQFAGALAGAGVLYFVASGEIHYSFDAVGLGQNGWGPDFGAEYSFQAAFFFEVVMTAILAAVYLAATRGGSDGAAAIAVGLVYAAIYIVGFQVTGGSVNPARSFGPAAILRGDALAQLPVFILAPLIGAAFAGAAFQMKLFEPDA